MSEAPKILASDQAWDEGTLGAEEEYVAVDETTAFTDLDASLELQMISIRLSKGLIEDFKNIAQIHGLGYQPLMRQALQRFAEGEKKMLLREAASEHIKNQRQREAERQSRLQAKVETGYGPVDSRPPEIKAA